MTSSEGTMTMIRQQEQTYLIDYMARSGDQWFYHFTPDQIDEVRRRIAVQVHRENLCVADFEQLDFALSDIRSIDELPPVGKPLSQPSWLDKFCDWCFGK